MSLAVAKSGELIAGTESPGRVFRIDASGKAFVLIDSPYREIHALRIAADGTIYAAAVSATFQRIQRSAVRALADAGRSVVPSVSTEITGMTVVDTGMPSGPTTPAAGRSAAGGRGAIYRIKTDGLWDTVWETPRTRRSHRRGRRQPAGRDGPTGRSSG